MKFSHLFCFASLWVAFFSLPILQTGCNSTTDSKNLTPEQTKLIASVAVKYATMKVVENNPSKSAKVIAVAEEVRKIAGSNGFDTVDLLMAFIKTRVDLSKLSPADQMLAGVLLDEIGLQLKSRIGSGKLTPDRLLIVGEVAGWVEDAARFSIKPT